MDASNDRPASVCIWFCSDRDFSNRNSTCLLSDRRSRFAISANFVFKSGDKRTNMAALSFVITEK
jgi:hypothetical protein